MKNKIFSIMVVMMMAMSLGTSFTSCNKEEQNENACTKSAKSAIEMEMSSQADSLQILDLFRSENHPSLTEVRNLGLNWIHNYPEKINNYKRESIIEVPVASEYSRDDKASMMLKPFKPKETFQVVYHYPECIKDMVSDPDPSMEFWDFDHIYTSHTYDTSGYRTYLIPAKGWFGDFVIMSVGVENDTIGMRYAEFWDCFWMEHPEEFWVDYWHYKNEVEFMEGTWNTVYSEYILWWVNPGLFDEQRGVYSKHDNRFPDFDGWWEMNPCEQGLIIGEAVTDVFLTAYTYFMAPGIGWFGGSLIVNGNHHLWKWMRRRACN